MGGLVVAIDGPSGSGKSTTAKGVARRLGLRYLDTGAMYRGVAVACLRVGVDKNDPEAVRRSAGRWSSTSRPIEAPSCRRRARHDRRGARAQVTAWVVPPRTPTAGPKSGQRAITRQRHVGGRDITTVVAPDADVRVLLLADPAARLARRGAEHGGRLDAAALHDQVLRRDRDDSRLVDFQHAAAGVTVVDSTYLSIDEAVAAVVALVPSGRRG
jgi:cytidylate kinase